jgi:phosphonate transport system ATP-binding protein
MLADEPVANLDPKAAEVVLDYLKPLTEEMCILGVFHAPDIVRKYCSRAIAIKDGMVVYDGPSDLPDDLIEYIYDNSVMADNGKIS